MMKKLSILLTLSVICFSWHVQGQNQIWEKSSKSEISSNETITGIPRTRDSEIYKLNREALENLLTDAPLRSETEISTLTAKFPNGHGGLDEYRITEAPIMPKALAEKYPMIKTYKAVNIDHPATTMRFSLTQFGFHALAISSHEQLVTDPYSKDRVYYTVYNKSSLEGFNGFNCELDTDKFEKNTPSPDAAARDTDDGILRTYELALGCTADYGEIFQDTDPELSPKENIQAQMVITINRVNEIYERDLGITLQFIENNDKLIFFGEGDNPFEADNYNAATQQTIDDSIGAPNYDIGHSFNTSGGGNAGCVGCVCVDGQKGSAFTGNPDPTGDPFYIDFVAHEMGHQFGAFHTMNTCSRSGNGETEVEPASGSSIMGYAGICQFNVQNNSDAHFAFVSIRNISNYIQSTSTGCADSTELSNQPPVADAGADYTIPKSTAFVLEGSATDPDGIESLTYNWAQNDPEAAPDFGPPQSDWEVGPLFRAMLPKESPQRYFPEKNTVLAGSLSSTWEVIPSVGRLMNFSFVVRDNGSGFASGIGQTDSDLMSVTVEGEAGPFTVTSQNDGVTWYRSESRLVSWDVAQTDQSPINAQNVDIKLSIDGGENFDITLAENTPNDGEEIITVPDEVSSENARVMVMASDNIFYAVNETAFDIVDSDFIFDIDQLNYTVCQEDDAVIDFSVQFTTDGFNGPVELSVENLPSGLTADFDNSSIDQNGEDVVLTLSDFNMIDPGVYEMQLSGSADGSQVTVPLSFEVYNSTVEEVILGQPQLNTEGVELQPTFSWEEDVNVTSYEFELATDEGFENVLVTNELEENAFNLSEIILDEFTTYYWRVRAENPCGQSGYSTSSFTTGACSVCPSSGNTEYQTSTTFVSFSDIENSSEKPGGYSDYTDEISTEVALGESYDLSVNVNTDSNAFNNFITSSTAWIDWNQNCNFEESETYFLGYAQGVSDGPTSETPLSITVPENALLGGTVMRISTKFYQNESDLVSSCETDFDGEVEDYTVIVRENLSTQNPTLSNKKSNFNIFPNPNKGEFKVSFYNAQLQTGNYSIEIFDLQGRRVFEKEYDAVKNFEAHIKTPDLSSGLYLVKFKTGNITQTEKLVIK